MVAFQGQNMYMNIYLFFRFAAELTREHCRPFIIHIYTFARLFVNAYMKIFNTVYKLVMQLTVFNFFCHLASHICGLLRTVKIF
jgi:hypothetical protein